MGEEKLDSKILGFINSINYDTNTNFKNIISSFKEIVNNSFDLIIEANEIDLKNNNGFKIELDVMNKLLDRALKENFEYGNVLVSTESEDEGFIYGKQIMNIGNVLVLFDGDSYTLIDLLIKNILVNNAVFFAYTGYMYGTNSLIIELFKNVLAKYELNEEQVEECVYKDITDIFKHQVNYDLVICIGNKTFQLNALKYSKTPIILSGYENFDLYVENKEFLEFINKILSLGIKATLYVKKGIQAGRNAIYVSGVEEAIASINFSGSSYSASIFTTNKKTASKFIREVKTSQVLINTSPTIERVLDINLRDLCREKTIVYPRNFKFEDKKIAVEKEVVDNNE